MAVHVSLKGIDPKSRPPLTQSAKQISHLGGVASNTFMRRSSNVAVRLSTANLVRPNKGTSKRGKCLSARGQRPAVANLVPHSSGHLGGTERNLSSPGVRLRGPRANAKANSAKDS